MSQTSRSVYRNRDDVWVNKKDGSSRASSSHKTQYEAIKAAEKMLSHKGGGEISIHGRNGKIRDKKTVYPGNDPFPPKG